MCGKRALLKHAFRKEVQNKCDASTNMKRRRGSPKVQVNLLFIGLCQQAEASVPGNGVGGRGTSRGCTGDTVLSTVSRVVHPGHALRVWPCSYWELLPLNTTAGAFPGPLCCRRYMGFAFYPFCFIWRSFAKLVLQPSWLFSDESREAEVSPRGQRRTGWGHSVPLSTGCTLCCCGTASH